MDSQPSGAPSCRNCGASAPGRYCPQCGQETHLHPPTFLEFVHEWADHYVALEGKVWKTLGALFTRPGLLTAEYFAGRRRRYVLPLRLYLTASIVFFLAASLAGTGQAPAEGSRGLKVQVHALDADSAFGQAMPAWFESRMKRSIDRLNAVSDAERAEFLIRGFLRHAPTAMFALLPLYALALRLAYARTGFLYGQHVVTSLHDHALVFFVFAFLQAPIPWWGVALLLTYAFSALYVAHRRAYGLRRRTVLWRTSLAGAAYLVFAVPVFSAVLMATLLG